MNVKPWIIVAAALGTVAFAGAANAAEPRHTQRTVQHRTHAYPARGTTVPVLPEGHYRVRYGGSRYYFHDGAWFRPYGSRFVVVAPPIGIGVPVLPSVYSTVWFGGVPYYYAADAYYVWRPERRRYVVTKLPADETPQATQAASDRIFVYPREGQTTEQQATDRYECHSWAVKETGYDPTQPLGGVEASQAASKRADYRRAEAACLEGRGYTVK